MGDGLVEWLYRRLRRRYAEFVLVVGFLALFVLTVIHVSVVAVLLEGTMSEYLAFLAEAAAAVMVVAAGSLLAMLRALSPVRARQGGDRSPEVNAAAWTGLVVRMPRIIAGTDLAICAAVAPVVFHAAAVKDLDIGGTVMLMLFATVMTLGGGMLVYLLVEILLRPFVREMAAALPAGFTAPQRTVSLAEKLLGLLLAINVYTAMLMAGLGRVSLSLEARVALALVISLTLPLALALMLRRTLLMRMHDLRSSLLRVRAGDLDTELPNIAGDEFDEVGQSFNAMLEGLREREHLQDELRASRARIVSAADASRRGVERDLHDGAQQHLVLLKLRLGMIERAAGEDERLGGMVAEAKAQLDRALAELRDLAHGIYPSSLTQGGLALALEEAGVRAGLPVRVECDGVARHAPELEAAVYFCCVEALQNAAKHAGAGATATIRLQEAEEELCFEIADDGRGFDSAARNGTAGLQNMADRVGALGGTLRVDSRPGRGTRVVGTVPA